MYFVKYAALRFCPNGHFSVLPEVWLFAVNHCAVSILSITFC